MIGVNDVVGEFNKGIKKCDYCGGKLDNILIENHGQGGWFKALECLDCCKRFNIVRLETIEEIRRERNKFSRYLSTLKKASLNK